MCCHLANGALILFIISDGTAVAPSLRLVRCWRLTDDASTDASDGSALIRSKSSYEYRLERFRNYHNVSICVAFAARRSRYASQNMGKASVNIG